MTVTDRDIQQGKPGQGMLCPVAVCIRRIYSDGDGNAPLVNVGADTIGINQHTFKTPDTVQHFLEQYDAGLPVKGFEFTLGDPLPCRV